MIENATYAGGKPDPSEASTGHVKKHLQLLESFEISVFDQY